MENTKAAAALSNAAAAAQRRRMIAQLHAGNPNPRTTQRVATRTSSMSQLIKLDECSIVPTAPIQPATSLLPLQLSSRLLEDQHHELVISTAPTAAIGNSAVNAGSTNTLLTSSSTVTTTAVVVAAGGGGSIGLGLGSNFSQRQQQPQQQASGMPMSPHRRASSKTTTMAAASTIASTIADLKKDFFGRVP
jgi:hypothetical protein